MFGRNKDNDRIKIVITQGESENKDRKLAGEALESLQKHVASLVDELVFAETTARVMHDISKEAFAEYVHECEDAAREHYKDYEQHDIIIHMLDEIFETAGPDGIVGAITAMMGGE